MCTGRKELNVQHRDFVRTVVLLVGVRFRHREVGFEKKNGLGMGLVPLWLSPSEPCTNFHTFICKFPKAQTRNALNISTLFVTFFMRKRVSSFCNYQLLCLQNYSTTPLQF